jgi:Domain of unknown function (DUF4148)
MRASIIVLTFAAYATTGIAHAAVSSPTADGKSASVQADKGSRSASGMAPKTRTQIRRELEQAQKDGQLAYLSRTLFVGS